MKSIFLLLAAATAAGGQTRTASISGAVLDAQTQAPIAAVMVTAIRDGLPPFSRNAKSGGDGAFQIQALEAGEYRLCVQAPGGEYIDPCLWGSPATARLAAGQAASGVVLRLSSASVVKIHVQDAQRLLSRPIRDGRVPELMVGVWTPGGLYYPARLSSSPGAPGNPAAGLSYEVAVPRDTAVRLHIASRELKLGDAGGVALSGNASQQTFLHAAGDPQPKTFTFRVLGLLP